MLFDLGPHLVDQALALFGAPDAITASVRADRDQTAIEDAFDITLHYPGANGKGLLAHCRTTATSPGYQRPPLPAAWNQGQLQEVRPRSAGTHAGRRCEGARPRVARSVAAGKGSRLGHTRRRAGARRSTRCWSKRQIKTEPGDLSQLLRERPRRAAGNCRTRRYF